MMCEDMSVVYCKCSVFLASYSYSASSESLHLFEPVISQPVFTLIYIYTALYFRYQCVKMKWCEMRFLLTLCNKIYANLLNVAYKVILLIHIKYCGTPVTLDSYPNSSGLVLEMVLETNCRFGCYMIIFYLARFDSVFMQRDASFLPCSMWHISTFTVSVTR